MGVLPQLIQLLLVDDWLSDHLMGFAEMLMLSVVSYLSLSLMVIIIDIFGPTNSELVECTSLVTSVLFSYYFIEAGSEFVAVHILAMTVFVFSFGLNMHSLAQKQTERDKAEERIELQRLETELTKISSMSTTVATASMAATVSKSQDIHKRTEQTE